MPDSRICSRLFALRAGAPSAIWLLALVLLPGLGPLSGSASSENFRLRLSPEEQVWLQAHPQIRIAFDGDFAPYSFQNNKGEFMGIAVDIARVLADRTGLELNIHPDGTWKNLYQAALERQVDVIATLVQRPDREPWFSFTEPYLALALQIITRQEDRSINRPEDLAGKRLALVAGYASTQQVLQSYPRVEVVLVDNQTEALEAVSSGVAEATVAALGEAQYIIATQGLPQLRFASRLEQGSSEQRFGVRKDWPELRSILQKGLDTISETERNEIFHSWVPVSYDPDPDYRLLWQLLALSAALLAVFIYWNRRLNRAKKIAEETQASLEFVQFAVDNAVDMAYWLTARDGRLFYVNQATVDRLGYSREEMVGMTIPQIDREFPMGDWALFVKKLMAAGTLTFETYNITKSGERFPVEVTARWVEFDKEDRFIAFGRDISERKQLEAGLIRAKEEAEQAKAAADEANQAKSTFLANMSHELRTPLAAILGYSQLMQRKMEPDDPLARYLQTINQSGQHLAELINDVLEVSKIEAGRIVLTPVPFDLDKLLFDVEEMMRKRAEEKQLELQVSLAEPLPRKLFGDEAKLRQILINLLSNAIKFTETGRVAVTVSGREQNGLELIIEVADTGPGIAAKELEQLFQPFEQTPTGRAKGGTGLGLVISRQYAQLMGGDLTVSSQVGQGSVFSCRCKVAEARTEPGPPEERQVIGLAPGAPQKTLLIVDDRDDLRNYLTQLLQEVGFTTLEARDGQEALAIMAAEAIDLVLLDMQMPKLDGYQTARQLKAGEQTRRVPLLAMSSSAFEENRQKILAAGANDFLRKPLDESELFAKIQRFLKVEYRYGVPLAGLRPGLSDQLARELQDVSAELRQELRAALVTLRQEQIIAVIEKIRPRNEGLAERLKQLAAEFRYDQMKELLEVDIAAKKT